MQLYSPQVSAQVAHKINNILDSNPRHFNKTSIRAMMIEDGFGKMNWTDMFLVCNRISKTKMRGEGEK